MAKITEAAADALADFRTASTQDGKPVLVATGVHPTVEAAILDHIAAEEMAEHADIAAKQEKAEAATIESEAADVAAGWREALGVAREMLVAVIPPLDPVWSNPRLDALSVALGRCDQAYGWGGAGKLLGHPLFGLFAAGAPIGYGTYQVVKPMMDKAKAEQAAKAATTAIKPGSMTPEQLAVAPGAPAFGS